MRRLAPWLTPLTPAGKSLWTDVAIYTWAPSWPNHEPLHADAERGRQLLGLYDGDRAQAFAAALGYALDNLAHNDPVEAMRELGAAASLVKATLDARDTAAHTAHPGQPALFDQDALQPVTLALVK